jgi:hypothetical protein
MDGRYLARCHCDIYDRSMDGHCRFALLPFVLPAVHIIVKMVWLKNESGLCEVSSRWDRLAGLVSIELKAYFHTFSHAKPEIVYVYYSPLDRSGLLNKSLYYFHQQKCLFRPTILGFLNRFTPNLDHHHSATWLYSYRLWSHFLKVDPVIPIKPTEILTIEVPIQAKEQQ